MQLRTLVFSLALCGSAAPLSAQIRDVRSPVNNWVGVSAGLYTKLDALYNPGVDGTWLFGDNALVYGGAFERRFSPTLSFGAEGSYATTEFQERVSSVTTIDGDATIVAAFVTGRLDGGGSDDLGFYLRGGIGTFGYKVEGAAETDYDFALSTGGGLEYRVRPRAALFLEYNQYWAYHEKGDIDDSNTGRHTAIRGGIRVGF